jgi:hypothetical protein
MCIPGCSIFEGASAVQLSGGLLIGTFLLSRSSMPALQICSACPFWKTWRCTCHTDAGYISNMCGCVCLQVKASPTPNTWHIRNIFIVGTVYGLFLTLSTWVLYHVRRG